MQDRVRRSGWQLPRPSPLSFLPGPHPPSTFAALSPTVAIEVRAASHLCLSTSTDCLRFAKNPFLFIFPLILVSHISIYITLLFFYHQCIHGQWLRTHEHTHDLPRQSESKSVMTSHKGRGSPSFKLSGRLRTVFSISRYRPIFGGGPISADGVGGRCAPRIGGCEPVGTAH